MKWRKTISHNRRDWPAVAVFLVAGLVYVLSAGAVGAQPAAGGRTAHTAATSPRAVVVPGFWDPRRRPERPDLSHLQSIRFLTDLDYPPFDYDGPDGNPAGFNVDLARLICDEIKVDCNIQ